MVRSKQLEKSLPLWEAKVEAKPEAAFDSAFFAVDLRRIWSTNDQSFLDFPSCLKSLLIRVLVLTNLPLKQRREWVWQLVSRERMLTS